MYTFSATEMIVNFVNEVNFAPAEPRAEGVFRWGAGGAILGPMLATLDKRGRVSVPKLAAFVAVFCIGGLIGALIVGSGLSPHRRVAALVRSLQSAPESRSQPPGRWRPARGELADADLTDEQQRELESLVALGYLDGSTRAGAEAGVVVHESPRAYEGLNLMTSGHGPEALLIDMDGRVLHSWCRSFDDIWPGRQLPPSTKTHRFWRRAHVCPNGDLLAIFEGLGLVRLDRDSEIVWAYDGLCHHDLQVEDNGSVFVLEREPRIVPSIHPERPILEDLVTELGPDGEVLRRVSILEAFSRSGYSPLLDQLSLDDPRFMGDVFHTNTLELLDGSLAELCQAFARGNALVSVLRLDTVAVLNLDEPVVEWALTGLWEEQHQPTFLPDGRLMVFDNRPTAGSSRVVEMDPLTQELLWSYEGAVDEPFFTSTCGSGQRLPNGNTLVTESDNGRAFEVTRGGQIVWEFVSPYRAGENGELVATLFEVVRLPPDFPTEWAVAPE